MSDVTIKAVVDVVAALEMGTLNGTLALFDNMRLRGSHGLGTASLATAASKGDRLIWSVLPIECEAYTELLDIQIPPAFCDVKRLMLPGTNISYWEGTLKKAVERLPYGLTLALGGTSLSLEAGTGPTLIAPRPLSE